MTGLQTGMLFWLKHKKLVWWCAYVYLNIHSLLGRTIPSVLIEELIFITLKEFLGIPRLLVLEKLSCLIVPLTTEKKFSLFSLRADSGFLSKDLKI